MQVGEIIADVFAQKNPNASEGKVEIERARFLRAPLVVAIVYRARKAKNPLWEQMLTCGAAAQNFLLAANACGYGAQWLSEWYAYDEDVRSSLGLDARDVVAGFMHVGSVKDAPEERDRPDLSAIVTRWSPDVTINKGDQYDRDKFGFPPLGFDLKK